MTQQTSSQPREHFGSRLGFILAAAGAAVGLGNIWGFPTQAASNGGGAFLLVYLVMILIVAFPMLVVEMAIGRHGQANPVDSMRALTNHPTGKKLGGIVGWIGLSVPSAVLAFYSIVGGWLICFLLGAVTDIMGMEAATQWLKGFSVERNLFGTRHREMVNTSNACVVRVIRFAVCLHHDAKRRDGRSEALLGA